MSKPTSSGRSSRVRSSIAKLSDGPSPFTIDALKSAFAFLSGSASSASSYADATINLDEASLAEDLFM